MTPKFPCAVFDCVVLLQANDMLDLMDETTATGSDFRRRFPHLLILSPVALIREISSAGPGADQTE
jgi:hypothetical protein